MIEIHQATHDDIDRLELLYEILGQYDAGYFAQCLARECYVFIACDAGRDAGFVVLNFSPKYNLYQRLGVPEIQDLNVIPDLRQRGIATALMEHCEAFARNEKGCEQIGVSVALSKDYGPAQRLYIKRGYIPDGMGVSFDRQYAAPERSYYLDSDLCLMLLKPL